MMKSVMKSVMKFFVAPDTGDEVKSFMMKSVMKSRLHHDEVAFIIKNGVRTGKRENPWVPWSRMMKMMK